MHIDKKILRNIFFIAGGCVVLAWILLQPERLGAVASYVWGLISPFVVGAAIAFVFNVPMRSIERFLEGIKRPGLRRTLAILLTIGAMVLVIAFVVELLIPQISATVESLVATIPQFVRRNVDRFMLFLEENPEIQEWVIANTEFESIDWASLLQKTGTVIGNSVSTIVDGAFGAITNVAGVIVDLVISLVFSIYCLAQKEVLARQARRLVYSILPEKVGDELIRIMRLTNSTFSNFISGQCLEAVILGGLFAVAMLILKLPYIPLVSVIIAVTALIPVVGAFVGCALGAFFMLVNDPVQAVTFVILFLVLQQLENNLIYPRVVGTSIGLPGMWVLVAVTIGGEVMGVAGMLVMIPLASVLYTLGGEITAKRLEARGIPEEKLVEQPPDGWSSRQQRKDRGERRRMKAMMDRFHRRRERKGK